jgi:hypothetical protein
LRRPTPGGRPRPAGLRFIGAGGIELMLAADDRVRRAGGRLVVLRGPSEAERPFELVAGEGRVELVDVPPAAIVVMTCVS